MDIRKCCEILELRPGYVEDDLKQAYKDLVQVWHPDRFAHNPRLREKAEDKLKQINTAYEVLDQALIDRAQRQIATNAAQASARANAARSGSGPSGQEHVVIEELLKKVTHNPGGAASSSVKLSLMMSLWALGLCLLPIGMVLLAYFLSRYFLPIIGLAIVVTVYFSIRWWVKQS
jgi:DnaJ-class molecular chaperone